MKEPKVSDMALCSKDHGEMVKDRGLLRSKTQHFDKESDKLEKISSSPTLGKLSIKDRRFSKIVDTVKLFNRKNSLHSAINE